jgi:hypothetical protein
VGGVLRVLLAHREVLASVGDVFAAVRDRTAAPVVSEAPSEVAGEAAGDA